LPAAWELTQLGYNIPALRGRVRAGRAGEGWTRRSRGSWPLT